QVSHLYVVGADGRGLRQLTHGLLGVSALAWSPDGHWIAFTGFPNYVAAAFVVRATGTGLRRILPRFRVRSLAWGPTGRLAIAGTLPGPGELAAQAGDLDGQRQRQQCPARRWTGHGTSGAQLRLGGGRPAPGRPHERVRGRPRPAPPDVHRLGPRRPTAPARYPGPPGQRAWYRLAAGRLSAGQHAAKLSDAWVTRERVDASQRFAPDHATRLPAHNPDADGARGRADLHRQQVGGPLRRRLHPPHLRSP